MLLAVLMLLGGAGVLIGGAGAAVRGASRSARSLGVSAFALGALLFGIDVEGLGAALVASGRGEASIAAGEAFGSIAFLFSAAFGAALLIARRPLDAPRPLMVLLPAGALLSGALAIADGSVTRVEGVALVAIYAAYVVVVVREGRAVDPGDRDDGERGRRPPALELLAGLLLVYAGASLLVGGGIRILERTALSAGFVGAALVGTLASADEVFLEVLPVRRGEPDLATGNLFGTLAAFTTAVPGLAALVSPLDVVDSGATSAFLAAAVLYTLVSGAFLLRGRAGRGTGVLVLLVYAGWLLLGARI